MSRSKKQPPKGDAFKSVEHRAYMEALRNGQRPPRAATFTDRRKKADKEACRKFRYAA
jgi:hypothetical protein